MISCCGTMKVVCVVVVLLSLISVCQPASLACQMLLQPVEKGPDVTGRWYLIAMSSNYCWAAALFNSFLVPSIQVDVSSTEEQNYYDANIKIKWFGPCFNKTFRYYYANNKAVETVENYEGVILHSRCPDCLILRDNNQVTFFVILSRRPNITATEMKEFEVLADCLNLYTPQVLNTDHDYGNCSVSEEGHFYSSEIPEFSKRVGNVFSELFTCTTDKVLHYPRAAFRWAQETWNSLW